MIDNKYIQERKEFFSVLFAITVIFLIYGLTYILNGWEWTGTSDPENILDRRLQTQVYLQGLSSTVKQARQLIVHGHISVDGAVTRVPGMTVTRLQEKNIVYSPSSALNSDLHPTNPYP